MVITYAGAGIVLHDSNLISNIVAIPRALILLQSYTATGFAKMAPDA
jgi:hypothetical protein